MNVNYTLKWILQKIYAVSILLTISFTFYSAYNIEIINYETLTLWFKSYLNSFSILVLLMSIFLHSNIGLSSIIDDYFHDKVLKGKIILIKNFFFAVLFLITIFSLSNLIIK